MFGWQKRLFETLKGIKLTEMLAKKDYDVLLYEAKNLRDKGKIIYTNPIGNEKDKRTKLVRLHRCCGGGPMGSDPLPPET